MSFLTPLFLLGALAIAIPIIVHLTHREKKEVVAFPSLMFVRKIPYRSVRRQRLRHLFLFALRALALLLLALAFARPFLSTSQTSAASPLGPREIIVLVDNSYSMGYEDRLERAKAEASSQVAAVGPEERATIIVFSDRAEIMNQASADKAELGAIVRGIELSSGTTRYGPALKLAKKVADESRLARKQVLLISDFQRLGWDGDEDAWLPAGTQLVPLSVAGEAASNHAVADVILERDRVSGRERLRASARVTYKAPADGGASARSIVLELDQRVVQTKEVRLEPNSAETVSFEPVTLPPGITRGTVRLESDSLPKDDAYHFVIWPGQSVSALVLEGPRGGRQRRSFYIEQALSIGDRPSFRLERKSVNQLNAADLEGRHAVLLNDVSTVGDRQAALLDEYVATGGGLIVILGEASGKNAFTGRAAQLLPAPPGASIDRARDWGGTLSYLDYDSPVFELFSAPHSGDFSSAKFFRYRDFDTPVSEGVLARYDDGGVALVEKRRGEGRVLVWTSTLDTFWNDLVRQPVFLPFLHQLVKHAAGYAEANSWQTVGDVADLTRYVELLDSAGSSASSKERDYDLVVSAPSGESSMIPPTDERPLLSLGEQGFYEVRRAGAASNEPVSLAVNLDLIESDLAQLDPEELVAAVTFREATLSEQAATSWSPSEQEGRQSGWWYLLLGAFVLLVSETLLSNRLSQAAR